MTKARIALVVLVISILAVLIVFPFRPKAPFILGYLGSLSGKFSALGASARNGAILAVEELNATGGIKGRKIQLSIHDDKGDPKEAERACQEMAEKGIGFMIGPFTTASATKMLPCINKRNILSIGPVVAGDNLVGQDDFFLKLFPSTKAFGASIAGLAIEQGVHRMVVVNDKRNHPFGETLTSGFQEVYGPGGGQLLHRIDYMPGKETSFSKIADEIADGVPEGVLIIASAIDTALLSQHIKHLLPSVTLYASPWSISKELINSGGEAVENLFAYLPYDKTSRRESFQRFKSAYRERFQEEAPFVAMFNYEAVHLMIKGIRNCASPEPRIVKETLLKMKNYSGVQSDYSLDETGDAKRSLFLYRIKDKAIARVE